MTAPKPGDVVTDEPTAVGTVVRDTDGDDWTLGADGKWRFSREAVTFSDLTDRRYGARLALTCAPEPAPAGDAAAELNAAAESLAGDAALPSNAHMRAGLDWSVSYLRHCAAHLRTAAPAPAEQWETITAADVRVGDHIEVTKGWDGGTFVATGTVTAISRTFVFFGRRHSFEVAGVDGRLFTSVAIRRRVRQQMREPEAPAVVRHAGRVIGRTSYDGITRRWVILGGDLVEHPDKDGGKLWSLTWPEVLALDPTVDPVVVDLGGGA